ncbi:MAG: glycosyltransferase family 4 protein [Muribaculaceae bacterium]|nr:glycosyltransferase family 4 protein [Muribaculaceae bacterium]
MAKLLFNLERTQPTATVKRHGGGIYGEIVFKRIVERNLPVEAVYDSSKWFNPELEKLCRDKGITLHNLASGKPMQHFVDKTGAQVFYTPLQLPELARLSGCRIVSTIHGLRDLELPADKFAFRYKTNLRGTVKQLLFTLFPKKWKRRKWNGVQQYFENDAVRYVTVSEQSKSSIQLFFPRQRKNDINVFYSPCTANVEPAPAIRDDKYFLLVSGNRWEKNNLRAIIALDRLYSDGIIADTKTVVTGVRDSSVFRYKLRNPDKFEFPGYVDDDQLAALYRDAFCFIYPTLNEGFGYPPLEAMRFGVPVLASPVTSVAEICGDGALYFNPYDIEEIQMRIIRVLNPEYHNELSALGKKRFDIVKARQESDLDLLIDYIYNS